jgi:hypothetical protein
MFGFISLMTESKKQVNSTLPALSFAKGVSLWGMKGPIPHIWGENSSINFRSQAKSSAVWKGEPTIKPAPTW